VLPGTLSQHDPTHLDYYAGRVIQRCASLKGEKVKILAILRITEPGTTSEPWVHRRRGNPKGRKVIITCRTIQGGTEKTDSLKLIYEPKTRAAESKVKPTQKKLAPE